ncbi:transcription termination factor 2, mitochondrial isoform 1-T2 [Discoglossus pictus]
MLKVILNNLLRWHNGSRFTCLPCKQIYPLWSTRCNTSRPLSSLYSGIDPNKSTEENKRTVDSLHKLSVNIKKIRQLKSWVLMKDVAFIEETANILKEMGANEVTVASIFECCPEAFLQTPTEINAQIFLWHMVCPKDEDLVKIIEKFPDSFFVYKCPENQRANITYFQDLGLSNKIICRLLTSSPPIFCNLVEDNKQIIDALKENYLKLGGSKENFRTWLMKLISQDPFVLSKSSLVMQNNIKLIQGLGFSDTEVLKLLSKLKGFIFDLDSENMQNSVLFSKTIFSCTDEELRQMILKCPALLYYSATMLEDRLKGLLKEGASIKQIKDCPSVLELTTQIIQYRITKITHVGHKIKDQHLEILNGTKKDFEVNFGKLQVKKARPLFNPVAPLPVEE